MNLIIKPIKKFKILIILFFSLFLFSCTEKPDSYNYCEERNVGYENEHTFCVVSQSFQPNTIDILVSWDYKNKTEFLGQGLTAISAFWSLPINCSSTELQSVTWYVDVSGEITYYVPKRFAEFNNPNPTPQMLSVVNGIDAEVTPYIKKWFC